MGEPLIDMCIFVGAFRGSRRAYSTFIVALCVEADEAIQPEGYDVGGGRRARDDFQFMLLVGGGEPMMDLRRRLRKEGRRAIDDTICIYVVSEKAFREKGRRAHRIF